MQKVINYIAFKASQIPNLGLYHGRMGMILALFSYAKCNNDSLLYNYANQLLNYSSMDDFVGDISLESGITGVGLCYTLLYKAKIINDDLNDLLWEIDNKLMCIDPRRFQDFSFRTGASGILYYYRMRLSLNVPLRSIDIDYIKELDNRFQSNNSRMIIHSSFMNDLDCPKWQLTDYLDRPVGIDKGSSYYIIKLFYDKVFFNQ